ncbi:MAG: pseudouridine synthase [Faecalibacterium sp.]
MRLDKYIAEAMQLPRKESRIQIQKGRVSVDGAICKKIDTQVNDESCVEYEGQSLTRTDFVYLMMNKPKGVVSVSTCARDTTVIDLVKAEYPRRQLFPAGRLDKASTGFVLITDDGAFAHEILSPRHHVPKEYTVMLDTPLTDRMRDGFAGGVKLADGSVMSPAKVWSISEDNYTVKVILQQGVYHQIKRMFGVFEVGVNELHRDAIGGLFLDENLAQGEARSLTAEELEKITKVVF